MLKAQPNPFALLKMFPISFRAVKHIWVGTLLEEVDPGATPTGNVTKVPYR